MENWVFLVIQFINIVLVAGILALMVGALLALRRYPLTPLQTFVWGALVLFMPVLGPAAFWLVGPPAQTRTLQ